MPPFMSVDAARTCTRTLPGSRPSETTEPHAVIRPECGLLVVTTIAVVLVGVAWLAVALMPIVYAATTVGVVVVLLWQLAQRVAYPATTERDEQTEQWLADLRNPEHIPVGGSWVGVNRSDRCAVGWLLERTNGRWYNGTTGLVHTSYWEVRTKYGQRLLTDVMAMNDRGEPWTGIADHVERKTRRLSR